MLNTKKGLPTHTFIGNLSLYLFPNYEKQKPRMLQTLLGFQFACYSYNEFDIIVFLLLQFLFSWYRLKIVKLLVKKHFNQFSYTFYDASVH